MKKTILLIILVCTITSCKRNSPNTYSLESFLRDRIAIGGFLKNSFTSLPEGISFTELSSKHKPFDRTFPGDDHIRSVVKRQRWTGHSNHSFTLNLSDDFLSLHNQNNSNTMTATQLLNHFFAGLRNLGFRNMGSPGVLMEHPIQYASNTWFKEHSNNISIFGTIYVDIEQKTALIDLKISEIY